jgi:phosphopentomutase
MLWGHRNDPAGMKRGLEEFDGWLAGFLQRLAPGDLLLLTADHGNDPTTPSTDHSREHVPLLALLAGSGPGRDLGTRRGFMDVAATLAEFFASERPAKGESFLAALRRGGTS